MKKKLILTLSSVLILCLFFSGCSEELSTRSSDILDTLASKGYTLSWSDEFEDSSLDTSIWNYEIGDGGWGNNEIQYYCDYDEEVFLESGVLNIVANKKNGTWLSGRITTQGKEQFQYGYIEAAVKLPEGEGMWPAFWLLGTSDSSGTINWPETGEFDIMEYSPATQGTDKVYSTLHTNNNNGGNGLSLGSKVIDAISDDYHRFGLLWTESYISAYYDGELIGTQVKASGADNNAWPFDREAFIILNLAIGGNLGGTVPDEAEKFVYLIDYVRIYQR